VTAVGSRLTVFKLRQQTEVKLRSSRGAHPIWLTCSPRTRDVRWFSPRELWCVRYIQNADALKMQNANCKTNTTVYNYNLLFYRQHVERPPVPEIIQSQYYYCCCSPIKVNLQHYLRITPSRLSLSLLADYVPPPQCPTRDFNSHSGRWKSSYCVVVTFIGYKMSACV
jgi:hypothetical protein